MNNTDTSRSNRKLFAELKSKLNLKSDKELAEKLSITPVYLSQIKNDNKPLSQKLRDRIEEVASESADPKSSKNAAPMPPASVDDIREVMIQEIKVDHEVQQRDRMNPRVTSDYGDILSDKKWPTSEWPFPPLDVFKTPEGLVLADGFHRFDAACKVLGENRDAEATVPCRIHEGTRDDALLFAIGANATHGLARTNADKRRAVQTLLSHPDWSKWSSRVIAERARVSHWLVNEIRGAPEKPPSALEAEPNQAEDQFNATGSPSSALDAGGDPGPAPKKAKSTGSSSIGLDVNGTDEPIEEPQPAPVDQPEKRKSKDGRMMPGRPGGPSAKNSRQSSSKPITDAAGKTQRSPTPKEPEQSIAALSSALSACRDESFSRSDHFKVAQRLVPSLKYALERLSHQDRGSLLEPPLEWHEDHNVERLEESNAYDSPSGDANVEKNAAA